MCQKCQKTLATMHPDFAKAMTDHGAELLAVLRKINAASNVAPMKELADRVNEAGKGGHLDRIEKSAASEFSPYVIGFLAGHATDGIEDTAMHVKLFLSGHEMGLAASSEAHDISAKLGLVEPKLTN